MAKQDEMQVQVNLRQYVEKGAVQFDKVLAIPLTGRIPHLTHVYGLETLHKLIGALLTRFNNELNLIRPMSAAQIEACSFEMVMTTEEDFLSIEDYMLFFRGAMEGKYGKILDRLDQQTIFNLLEEYRQERHRQYRRIHEERHAEHKGLGPSERTCNPDPISDAMANYGNRLNQMKEALKTQREINRMNKFSKDL